MTEFKFTCNERRIGQIETAHGVIRTPAFMPVGTVATVKGMMPEQVKELGADIILGNTYHLMLRPTAERIAKLGGLHKFMNWSKPILTDSGGFQVMSLSKLRKITEHGVTFQSHLSGEKFELTPERSIEIQHLLGSTITMAFDECTPFPATWEEAKKSMEMSMRWAERSKKAFIRLKTPPLRGSQISNADLEGGRKYNTNLIERSQEMRKEPTIWENKLWQIIKNEQLGYKFRRQQPIGNYIVDFVNFEKNIIIELDGSGHKEQAAYDSERDKYLTACGFKVLRFWNNELDTNITGVLEKIKFELENTPHQDAAHLDSPSKGGVGIFGIVQGGIYPDLRKASIEALTQIGFDGYAIGGLAVGEGQELMFKVLDELMPHMPTNTPRYLMGVGKPDDIIGAVARGVDMFDCVLPTRNGRNGQAFTSYGVVNIRNSKYADDQEPLDPATDSPANNYSKAYLHHLFKAGEMLGPMLLTWHNLKYYQDTMAKLRQI